MSKKHHDKNNDEENRDEAGSQTDPGLDYAEAYSQQDPETDTANAEAASEEGKAGGKGGKDEEGSPIERMIRKQPVLALSLAFGLGLVVTSMMAGRRS
jgi:hypothetical protein